MIVLSNTSEQVVPVGQALTFNTVVHKSGCAEGYRTGTGAVKLRANNAIYELSFAANVTGATATNPVQLSMAISGATLPETTMIYTPAVANAVGNVGSSTLVKNCCGDYGRITIVNTGTDPITVSPNCCLFVKRIA